MITSTKSEFDRDDTTWRLLDIWNIVFHVSPALSLPAISHRAIFPRYPRHSRRQNSFSDHGFHLRLFCISARQIKKSESFLSDLCGIRVLVPPDGHLKQRLLGSSRCVVHGAVDRITLFSNHEKKRPPFSGVRRLSGFQSTSDLPCALVGCTMVQERSLVETFPSNSACMIPGDHSFMDRRAPIDGSHNCVLIPGGHVPAINHGRCHRL